MEKCSNLCLLLIVLATSKTSTDNLGWNFSSRQINFFAGNKIVYSSCSSCSCSSCSSCSFCSSSSCSFCSSGSSCSSCSSCSCSACSSCSFCFSCCSCLSCSFVFSCSCFFVLFYHVLVLDHFVVAQIRVKDCQPPFIKHP